MHQTMMSISNNPTPGAGEFKTNTASTSYTIGPLANNTQYYWRIDANNVVGKTTGDVWNFTTAASALLVNLDASGLALGALTTWTNSGIIGGSFGNDTTNPVVEMVGGVKAVTFTGDDRMKSTFTSPSIITGNGNYTISVLAYNPAIADEECLINWAHRGGATAGTAAQVNYGTNASRGAVMHLIRLIWVLPEVHRVQVRGI